MIEQLEVKLIKPKKYWYREEIEICVLCGSEKYYRERVYDEKEKGKFFKDYACDIHFI